MSIDQSDSATPPNQDQQRDGDGKSAKMPDNVLEKSGSKQAQQTEAKKWHKRWQVQATIITIIVGILTILTLLLEIPKKWREAFPPETEEKIETLAVKGSVLTTDNQPVRGAIVKLNKLPGDSAVTTSDGGFLFREVPGQVGESVRVYVQATGYESWDQYQVLPGPIEIRLEEETAAN